MAKFNPFSHPIIFSLPGYLAPSKWARHVPFAMFLVDIAQPTILVDLDAVSTVPYLAFCQAVKELRLGTKCYGIILKDEEIHHEDHQKQKTLLKLYQHLELNYGEFSTLIHDSFEGATQHFRESSIDFLHIDLNIKGNPTHQHFETWLSKMSDQGVILFHNINEQHNPAGWVFWKEVKSHCPSFEIPHGHGLGLLAVGKHIPDKLKQTLLDQDDTAKNQIVDFFLKRGDSLIPLSEVEEKDSEMESLRVKMYQLERSNNILRYEKRVLENSLREAQNALFMFKQENVRRVINRVFPPGSNQRKLAGIIKTTIRSKFNWSFTRPSKKHSQDVNHPPLLQNENAPIITPPNMGATAQHFADVYFNLLSRTGKLDDDYVHLAMDDFGPLEAPAKLIAFYLPQFHPIPENDEWWGRGFTEWINVSKAVPNFAGHYQPHLPGELNFYDLRLPEILKRQVELAKKYGVYGFCFYYYWFSGKRLLELPLNQFIENVELDLPFCICWANENWTRRWDGAESNILIGQAYSEEEYAAFIRDIVPILLDKRYINIDGKPLLAVYRINLLPDPKKAVEIWRTECKKLGVGDIFLAAIQSFDIEDPRLYGFDGAVEFPPHNCLDIAAAVDFQNLNLTNPNFTGNVFDYQKAAELMIERPVPDYLKFKTVMPSWDNTARRQNDSVIFINSRPSIYRDWLEKSIQYTRTTLPKEMQLIFINAWNEWAEGTHLEPDRLYGYAHLQATRDALNNYRS